MTAKTAPITLRGLTLVHFSGQEHRLRWEVARCLGEAIGDVIVSGGQSATCGWVIRREGRAYWLDGRRFGFGQTRVTPAQMVALCESLRRTSRVAPVFSRSAAA